MVEREEDPGAEALDLQGPPQLAAKGVEHAVQPDDDKRQVDQDDGGGGQRDRREESPAPAPSVRGDRYERHEHRGIELHGDTDPQDERTCVVAPGDEEHERPGDERRRQQVEASQDHTAEQERQQRDRRQRDPALVVAPA